MQREPSYRRSGVTLTELLVVVSIIVLMTSALLPMLQPVLKGQGAREAARQLNVFIAGAQARAVQSGKPVGVWIERVAHEETDPAQQWYTAHRMYIAEEPPPYAGDTLEARLVVQNPSTPQPATWTALFKPLGSCPSSLRMIQPGDFVQFNYRGPRFQIVNRIPPGVGTDPFGIEFMLPPTWDGTRGQPVGHPQKYVGKNEGVPFQVFRRPTKSVVAAMELPRNVGIDLSLSGYSTVGTMDPEREALPAFRVIDPEYDLVIMFSPDGGVQYVYYVMSHEDPMHPAADGSDSHENLLPVVVERPTGPIRLMLARDDLIGQDITKNLATTQVHAENVLNPLLGDANLADTTNLWLTIDTHSGRVTTGPNAGLPTSGLPLVDLREKILYARQLADQGQSLGGR